MKTPLLACALACGILAGCGGGPIYGKPGVTYSQWKRDDAECREAGRSDGRSDADAHLRCMQGRGYGEPPL